MNKFYEFMRDRYGADALSAVIVIVSFALLLIVSCFDVWWLSFLPLLLVIYAAFRILSKNISAREKENEFIVNIKEALLSLTKREKEDDTHIFAKCPVCGAKLRLPKGKGEFSITCPACKKKMRVRT
ncbi:MAG: hypothetical protein E7587_09690 [Ruminococcaceae bacterium]|nr:hypothetical protein [Oscillospiraceae bacterium]